MCFDSNFYLLVWEYFVDLRELNLRFLDGEKILVLCILHPTQSTTGSTGIGLLCVGPLILLQVLDFCTRNHETGCTFDGYKFLFCDVTKSDRPNWLQSCVLSYHRPLQFSAAVASKLLEWGNKRARVMRTATITATSQLGMTALTVTQLCQVQHQYYYCPACATLYGPPWTCCSIVTINLKQWFQLKGRFRKNRYRFRGGIFHMLNCPCVSWFITWVGTVPINCF